MILVSLTSLTELWLQLVAVVFSGGFVIDDAETMVMDAMIFGHVHTFDDLAEFFCDFLSLDFKSLGQFAAFNLEVP